MGAAQRYRRVADQVDGAAGSFGGALASTPMNRRGGLESGQWERNLPEVSPPHLLFQPAAGNGAEPVSVQRRGYGVPCCRPPNLR